MLASVIFNYGAGYLMSWERRKDNAKCGRSPLICAIAGDLLLLAYFKYAGFFLDAANQMLGWGPNFGRILLPLGISFFTFTQIAFLVDVFQGKAKELNFTHYLLFVTYFPHLIAGPILHHSQMMPQFAEQKTYRMDWANISTGLTVFVIGFAKKVLIADYFSTIATPIFSAAQNGNGPALIEAWTGALAYTLQLYFDFSGYSDMAIGLSLFFNVKIPLNFNSPYKAVNIIEFWRRWHMTLSAFLRDYLYIALGGNRKGKERRYVNLFATMILGGLWHGAGWTFVFWGALHGFYLIINHGFRAFCTRIGWRCGTFGRAGELAAAGITFLSVVIAWVFFRADSFATADIMLHGMAGSFGLRRAAIVQDGGAVVSRFFAASGIEGQLAVVVVFLGLAAVWSLPNTQEFMRFFDLNSEGENVTKPRGLAARLVWQPDRWWTWSLVGILFALSILMISPARVSEFLYYQF